MAVAYFTDVDSIGDWSFFMYISDLTYVATIYDLIDYVAVDNVDNVH